MHIYELELDEHLRESKAPRCPFILSPGSNKDWYEVPGMVEGLTDITSYEITDIKKRGIKGIRW